MVQNNSEVTSRDHEIEIQCETDFGAASLGLILNDTRSCLSNCAIFPVKGILLTEYSCLSLRSMLRRSSTQSGSIDTALIPPFLNITTLLNKLSVGSNFIGIGHLLIFLPKTDERPFSFDDEFLWRQSFEYLVSQLDNFFEACHVMVSVDQSSERGVNSRKLALDRHDHLAMVYYHLHKDNQGVDLQEV